jgi:hypothetical protein
MGKSLSGSSRWRNASELAWHRQTFIQASKQQFLGFAPA